MQGTMTEAMVTAGLMRTKELGLTTAKQMSWASAAATPEVMKFVIGSHMLTMTIGGTTGTLDDHSRWLGAVDGERPIGQEPTSGH